MFHEFVGLIRIYKIRVISLPCLNNLDFFKAIDRVNCNMLLHKLKVLNISEKVLKWLVTFFQKRQQVKVKVLFRIVPYTLMTDNDRNTQNANLSPLQMM